MSRMEILEVVRRWQAGESRRVVARGVGLARATVDKYVAAAERLGLALGGDPPTEGQVLALVQLGRTSGRRATPARSPLAPHRVRIEEWLGTERLRLTRVHELLGQNGV